jgi:serine/threonine-protein kinase
MAYCYQCGSEVKKSDFFCPYCGISFQSAVLPEEKNDKTQEVILMPDQKDVIRDETLSLEFDSQIPVRRISVLENKLIEENEQKLENGFTTEKNNVQFTESNADNEFQNPDLPELTERKSVDADALGNPLVSQEDLPESVVSPDDNEKLIEKDNQTESSLMNYEEVEVKEGLDVEELNDENLNSPSNGVAEDNESENTVKPIPYIPPAGEKIESSEEDYVSQNINEKNESLSLKDETLSAAEQPIIKPETELENPENQTLQPRFDSVRIMEPQERDGKNYSENSPENERLISDSGKTNLEKPVSDDSQNQKNGHPFTTPNIGISTDGKKSAKLKPLEEGAVLNGRYEIVRKIGGGGMGAVYLASDKNLGGVLRAVKEMVQSYIEDEQQEKAVNDFKRESMLLTSLEHQSIPTIFDYFFDEKEARFYLVMKYISGGDLALRLRAAPEGRIDERSVTEWGIQIADVLDYLHNRQPPIVYRDLKPANIMVDGNLGRAMLIDFGIARWINKEEKGVTAVGTMGYAPPELFSGNVEPRSDIYSLGSTMFHLLTGADPQSNPLLIFDFQKHPRPRQINPQLSDQIEKILMRAVEYNADKRFSSALEMRQALEKNLENLKSGKATFGVREVPAPVSLSQQQVFCGFCGQKIVATDMFCAFCGAKQPMARQGVHSENYVSRNVTAQLLIVGTNELETPVFTIEKDENLLGRRDPMSNIFPEVDLSKFDPQTKISRRHARIRREGDCFLVEDLGSSNGTIVMSPVKETVRLQPRQPYTLTNGDKLKLGDTTLHFIIG